MFKKILLFYFINLFFNHFAFANIEIKARTAILQDFLSGEILYEKDIYTNLTNEIEVSKDLINSDIFLFTDKLK